MADPIQARAKEKRRAEALRANLKRRKEQTRGRGDDGAQGGDPKAGTGDANVARRDERNE